MPWRSFWAKSSPFHPLWKHSIDVGSVGVRLWAEVLSGASRQRLTDYFGMALNEARNLVLWILALHDLGKATPDFQGNRRANLWHQVERAGLSIPQTPSPLPHGESTSAILFSMLKDGGWGPLVALMASRCSGGHHGFPPSANRKWNDAPRISRPDAARWQVAQRQLAATVQLGLGLSFPSQPSSNLDQAALGFLDVAGLISFCDWIGSAEEFFAGKAGSSPDEPSEYAAWSLEQAGKALRDFGWQSFGRTCAEQTYAALFPDVFGTPDIRPRPLQEAVAEILQQHPKTRLLLIEAPMGEGKTEAALFAARYWLERHTQPGVYIALPTQATSNAMYDRFRGWIEALKLEAPVDTLLLHSGLIKPAVYEQTIRATARTEYFDQEDSPGSAATAHEWFLQAKRGLLAPFGVGTIDQALLGVLRCRHHFVRLHGLAGKTVIFDEVHAYDVYTGRLLDRLLEYLGKMGCTVALLSATLPSQRRRELVEAFCGGGTARGEEAPYPRITFSGGAGEEACSLSLNGMGASAAGKDVCIEWLPSELEEALASFVGRLGESGCGAFVFNTVTDCQKAYRHLAANLPPGWAKEDLFILHSRFPAGQRLELEERLKNAFGKAGRRPCRALVLATQVIEQSLDVDFDLMGSDLAPIDLLLQRSGRLHRHSGRERGGHQRPILFVRSPPEKDGLPSYARFRHIYDPKALVRTHAILLSRRTVTIPDEMEECIERVYTNNDLELIPTDWRPAYTKAEQQSQDEAKKRSSFAETKLIESGRNPDQLAELWENVGDDRLPDEDDAALHFDSRPMTRLGEDSRRVLCLFERGGKLFLDFEGTRRVDGSTPLQSLVQQVAQVSEVHVRRGGIEEIDFTCRPLDEWKDRGILRHLPVLPFDAARSFQMSQVRIVWDEEVGICYER